MENTKNMLWIDDNAKYFEGLVEGIIKDKMGDFKHTWLKVGNFNRKLNPDEDEINTDIYIERIRSVESDKIDGIPSDEDLKRIADEVMGTIAKSDFQYFGLDLIYYEGDFDKLRHKKPILSILLYVELLRLKAENKIKSVVVYSNFIAEGGMRVLWPAALNKYDASLLQPKIFPLNDLSKDLDYPIPYTVNKFLFAIKGESDE